MLNKKIKFILGLSIFCLWISVEAMDILDVNSRLYRDINTWYRAGIISHIPPLQPYSLPVIKTILKTVVHSAYPSEVVKAQKYLYRLERRILLNAGVGSWNSFVMGREGNMALLINPQFQFGLNINEIVSGVLNYVPMFIHRKYKENKRYSGGLSLRIFSAQRSADFHTVQKWFAMPYGQNPHFLPSEDNTTLFGWPLSWRNFFTGGASVGVFYDDVYTINPWVKSKKYISYGQLFPEKESTEENVFEYLPQYQGFFLMLNISRLNMGPIYANSVFMGGQTPETPNATFYWRVFNWLGFTLNYSNLIATGINDTTANGNPDGRSYPNKHFIFHQLDFYPFDFWTISMNESILFGNRFDPSFLFPLSVFFLTSGTEGYEPNHSNIGLSTNFRIPYNMNLALAINFDDLAFLAFKKGAKLAFQGSFSWNPLFPWLRSIEFTYTMIFPFTFTHLNNKSLLKKLIGDTAPPINYTNNTSNGFPLGATLDPNSDRVQLIIVFEPFPFLKKRTWSIEWTNTLIRHGDPNEKYPEYQKNNKAKNIRGGGIFDTGYHDKVTYYDRSDFLNQNILLYVYQFSIKSEYDIMLNKHNLLISLTYVIEAIWNDQLIKNNNRINQYLQFQIGYKYNFL